MRTASGPRSRCSAIRRPPRTGLPKSGSWLMPGNTSKRMICMHPSGRAWRWRINLQGIWADQLQTPWNSDHHLNINMQMPSRKRSRRPWRNWQPRASARMAQSSNGELRRRWPRIPPTATFYAFFTLKPQGEHTLVVCRGIRLPGQPLVIFGKVTRAAVPKLVAALAKGEIPREHGLCGSRRLVKHPARDIRIVPRVPAGTNRMSSHPVAKPANPLARAFRSGRRFQQWPSLQPQFPSP